MSYDAIVYLKNNTEEPIVDFWNNKIKFEKKDKVSEYKKIVLSKEEEKGKIENLQKFCFSKDDIKKCIPNSFVIKTQIKLTASYYSRDDDDFYLIPNPVMKEKVFKIPMVRGSSWKGALLHAGIEIFKEEVENEKRNSPKNSNYKSLEYLGNIFRIFGVGNNEYRELFDDKDKAICDKVLLFLALEMGVNLNKTREEQLEKYFKTRAQKGRAIFYPTYFDKVSLEVINPHNRKTKAGTNPIFYEVVPKGATGDLQIVYLPFDGVLKKVDEVEKEAKSDFEFLQKCICKVARDIGIGAKTKLGWGRFEIYLNDDNKYGCEWSNKNTDINCKELFKDCEELFKCQDV